MIVLALWIGLILDSLCSAAFVGGFVVDVSWRSGAFDVGFAGSIFLLGRCINGARAGEMAFRCCALTCFVS